MGLKIDIFIILEEDAEKDKRKLIQELASKVQHFFNGGIMEHTLEAMAEEPLPGEPEGNCHAIALGFMTDLIIARQT